MFEWVRGSDQGDFTFSGHFDNELSNGAWGDGDPLGSLSLERGARVGDTFSVSVHSSHF